jgi:energy-coupling factor transporter ATP-binding protein EcfA2
MDCPYLKQNKSNFQKASGSTSQGKGNVASTQAGKGERKTGRVYYTQVATTPEGEPLMMGTFFVANHHIVILFYSGASHTFISKAFVEKNCISCVESKNGIVFQSPWGQLFNKEIVFPPPP